MAKNLVYAGETTGGDELELPVPTGTLSGAPVKSGAHVGVTVTKEGAGVGNRAGYASVWMRGTWKLDVEGAIAAPGTPVYITATNTLTTTAAGNTYFGNTVEGPSAAPIATKAAGTGTAYVKIAKV